MIKFRKKCKTRGRRSKIERTAEEVISWMMNQPEYKNEINKRITELILYGQTPKRIRR